jgi:PilZ domain-containing protein/flagellar protein YcgR
VIRETPEARRERDRCPVCRSPHRQTIERMRRWDRAPYAAVARSVRSLGADISVRAIMRHFIRGHDHLIPQSDPELPTWLLEDDGEMERYTRDEGYCRTIDDLCPHVPAGTASACAQINHPECERFRLHALMERMLDLEARSAEPEAAPQQAGERVVLTEPLAPMKTIEVEARSGTRRGIYASTVLALEPTKIVISVPTRLHEMLPLAAGDNVAISYQGRVSKYVFETAVRAVKENRVELDPPASVGIASRRSPRIPLRDSGVKVVRVERALEEVSGTAIDASMQGVRAVMTQQLGQWERVRVTVSLPDGPLTADGEVVRVERLADRQISHGIYFVGLSSDNIARLRRLGG